MGQIRIEPRVQFDSCIVDEQDGRLVYSIVKIIQVLEKSFADGGDPKPRRSAWEWYNYNISSFKYMEGGPVFLEERDAGHPN